MMETEVLIIISVIATYTCGLLVGMIIEKEKALLEDKAETPKSKSEEKEKGET